ncbi:MAG TPA: HypC/HybG/HupF family hydrogenase formation chaperone [Actinomycetota bacterium]
MCLALPARVIEVDPGGRSARVEVEGRTLEVSLDLLAVQGIEVRPDGWLLVSAGAALEALDPATAEDLRTGWEERAP